MKDKGYYKHWMLPEIKILYDIKGCNHWRHIMPGNTPGSNPLDMQCFHDSKSRVNELVRITQSYGEEDSRKYSLSTYKRGLSAYERVWQTTPTSKRIVEDIDAIAGTYQEIIKHKGVLCPADKNSGGNRFHRRGGHSGKRKKESVM